MIDRSQKLLDVRPEIPNAQITNTMRAEEKFQNGTLRPIIKLQNDLLIATFKNYVRKYKNAFFELSLEQRMKYIENAIQKDIKYRNALKGIIIGQFTVEEYATYIENSSALNKRMMNMTIERLKDQVILLEDGVLVQ